MMEGPRDSCAGTRDSQVSPAFQKMSHNEGDTATGTTTCIWCHKGRQSYGGCCCPVLAGRLFQRQEWHKRQWHSWQQVRRDPHLLCPDPHASLGTPRPGTGCVC